MSEFPNHSISVSRLPSPSEVIKLAADKVTLDRVAQECGVSSISELRTKLRLKRYRKHGLTIFGEFSANIEQDCIVTLEPMISKISETFERQFLPQKDSDYKMPEIIDGEMVLDPEADDIPDLLESDELNLWEVLIEEMILVINPFPRSQNIADEFMESEEIKETDHKEPMHKPFADLKALITEKKSKN